MTTTVPLGTYVRFRYRGDWQYAKISQTVNRQLETVLAYSPMHPFYVPVDAVIHQCVWKKDELVFRRIVKRPKDIKAPIVVHPPTADEMKAGVASLMEIKIYQDYKP